MKVSGLVATKRALICSLVRSRFFTGVSRLLLLSVFYQNGAMAGVPNMLEQVSSGNLQSVVREVDNLRPRGEQKRYLNFLTDLQNFCSGYSGSNDPELNCFVPSFPNDVSVQWLTARNVLRDEVGIISPTKSVSDLSWENSASTASELYETAQRNVDGFISVLNEIANNVPGAVASFGPNNAFAVKSLQSIMDKIARLVAVKGITEANAAKLLADSLRGTIIVNTPSQLVQVISLLNQQFSSQQISFSNKFNATYATGYVGVHGDILYKNQSDVILSEIQVHYSNVYDGTPDCPKEYAHGLYEATRSLVLNDTGGSQTLEVNGNAAQTIVYLFGMDRVIQGIIPQPGISSYHDALSGQLSDSNYEYYFDSGVLFRSPPVVFNTSSNISAEIPTLEVFSPIDSSWEAITNLSLLLDIYGDLTEGDILSASIAQDYMNQLKGGGGTTCSSSPGCIAGAVIGSVFGAAILVGIVKWCRSKGGFAGL